jgi:hypothetical protein
MAKNNAIETGDLKILKGQSTMILTDLDYMTTMIVGSHIGPGARI